MTGHDPGLWAGRPCQHIRHSDGRGGEASRRTYRSGQANSWLLPVELASAVRRHGRLDLASAIFTATDGNGYWISTADGKGFDFRDAPNDGGMVGGHLNAPIIAAVGR